MILNYATINSVAQGNGKMTVPVHPSQSMYATYSNVKGVPAPDETAGLSLIGLKIVDTIIENIRSARAAQRSTMDGMDSYRELLQKFQRAQQGMGPYAPKLSSGLVLDLTA